MAGIADLLGMGTPGASVFNIMQGDGSALPQQQAAPPAYHAPHGIKAFLGALGDALLAGSGGKPVYRDYVDEQRQNSALSGFLTDPDQAIQQLMQVDPKLGIALYSQVHPKSEVPQGVREYDYYNKLPVGEKPAFEKFLQLTHPGMMAPITLGPTDTYDSGSTAPAGSGPPGSAIEYLKAHPDLAAHFDEKYGAGASAKVLGGQTPRASGNFPVNNPGALRVPGSTKFQSFASPQEGIQAQQALLGRYMGRGLRNVSSIVETYAPRQSRGGDNSDAQVNGYIGYVSRRLGVNPQDALSPTLLPKLAQAMREFETGQRVN